MKRVKITVMRKTCHRDLMARYENPIEHACDMHEGDVFIAEGWQKPEGLCESAWMKNPASAMISCNDGFRPVSFLLETIEQ